MVLMSGRGCGRAACHLLGTSVKQYRPSPDAPESREQTIRLLYSRSINLADCFGSRTRGREIRRATSMYRYFLLNARASGVPSRPTPGTSCTVLGGIKRKSESDLIISQYRPGRRPVRLGTSRTGLGGREGGEIGISRVG